MKNENNLSAAEIKLLMLEHTEEAHQKLRKELPEILRPVLQDTTEVALKRFGKKLGIDFDCVESVNKYHRERAFVEKKMEVEEDFKRTVFSGVAKFSIAGFLGWCVSKLIGGS